MGFRLDRLLGFYNIRHNIANPSWIRKGVFIKGLQFIARIPNFSQQVEITQRINGRLNKKSFFFLALTLTLTIFWKHHTVRVFLWNISIKKVFWLKKRKKRASAQNRVTNVSHAQTAPSKTTQTLLVCVRRTLALGSVIWISISKATLGKLLKDGVERIWAFPGA